ncbi:MAG: glycerol-3-phosphate dehydrogenase/oxidase [Akkermansiaceae bacterium]|nr:glycerol-3-phosphate dehydrogenase/oxidase [Akkermansiaceae bacterium]
MKTRAETWAELKRKDTCEVLILGGGVNGAGLMRELALNGVGCVLVDKSDFAAGASSTSSRMIHGGLRYLENAELALVKEAVTERNRLLRYAPHFVGPLKTTIPVKSWLAGMIKSPLVFFGLPVTPGGRGAVIFKLGLMCYDLITARNRRTPPHFFTSRNKSLAEIPGLVDDIACTATYWDAWISQAERLCVDMLAEACRDNPECLAVNYVTARKSGGDTVVLRNLENGEESTIKPSIVVNATGAWVDRANLELGFESRFMGGTKGSHLVVDNQELYDALGDRMIYYEHLDGRICITFRFMDKVIVGSTDIRVDDPDLAECEEKEIDYMLTTLKGVFPRLEISRGDIVYKFCGVRPLPASGLDFTSRVPRSHRIDVAAPDAGRDFTIYSLIGGKLTTFRALAEAVADLVFPVLKKSRKVSTRDRPFPCAKDFPVDAQQATLWTRRVAAAFGLDEKQVANLLLRYGTEAETLIAEDPAAWRQPLQSLPDYCVGEIQHIAPHECVHHLSDIVRRRGTITLLGQAQEPALREIADIAGEILDWSPERRGAEIVMAAKEAAGKPSPPQTNP